MVFNEGMVKDITGVNDNLAGGYLSSAMVEAQESDLKRVLGARLLATLKTKASEHTLDGDDVYSQLHKLFCFQSFLAYSSVARCIFKVAFKVGNIGAVRTSDDTAAVMSFNEVDKLRVYYQAEADRNCGELQAWLLDHSSDIPELTEGDCHEMKSHLSTSFQCGLFLGGARGRSL